MESKFQTLVLSSYILYVIAFFIPNIIFPYIDEEIIELLAFTGYGGSIPLDHVLPYLFLALYSLVALGLLYFKTWAKDLFVILVIINICWSLFSGIRVSTAMENFLYYIINLCDGAVLVMLYFTEVKHKFDSNT